LDFEMAQMVYASAMIPRTLESHVRLLAGQFPALAIVGPRQSGKTTLAQLTFQDLPYRSLETPDVRERATNDPRQFLNELADGAILDEVQRVPHLMSYLQEYIDRDRRPGRWILTGSQNFSLLESITQSLAGRIAICHLLPLSYAESAPHGADPDDLASVIVRGGYPALHASTIDGPTWLASYLTAYVERDVRQVLRVTDLESFQLFVQLVATRAGQLLNMASLAADVGVSQPTIKSWLGVLEASYIVLRVPPFHSNLGKRLVKSPKLQFIDSGLLTHLLGIRTPEQFLGHPQRGAIFESWVVSEIVKSRFNRGNVGGLAARTTFMRDSHGQEVDLVCETVSPTGRPTLRLIEAKHSQTPSGDWLGAPRGVAAAHAQTYDLEAFAIYAGNERQTRSTGTILPWREIHSVEW